MWLEDHNILATHLIRDRDRKFTKSFDKLMHSAGINTVKSPVQAPDANAFAQAWVALQQNPTPLHLIIVDRQGGSRIVKQA